MGKIINRLFELNLPPHKSAFIWGPRKVGKSFWIKKNLQDVKIIDLLDAKQFFDYSSHPGLLHERLAGEKRRVVIDEIQKIPALLDVVHQLIETDGMSFILTGSSARKLKKSHANLLGGRAYRRQITPLCFGELNTFSMPTIERTLSSGLIPSHFLSETPKEELRSYVADYLKEEIAAEAVVQNLPAFSEFLRVSSITSGELLNYTNIASECGVSAKVIRSYFQILEDTFLGYRLAPWKKAKNRRLALTEKFYLFDVGVSSYLSRREPKIGTPEFGKAFEHLVLMELKAYQAYRNPELPISFWRTSHQQEIDFILGEKEVAIEAKGSNRVRGENLKTFDLLEEDGKVKKKFVVSLESERRMINGIEILPFKLFVERLWADQIIK